MARQQTDAEIIARVTFVEDRSWSYAHEWLISR